MRKSSGTPSSLLPQHRDLIRESAISRDVATVRGYRSVTDPAKLRRQGFSDAQSELVPGLLIPVWDIYGKNERSQFRPDKPRLDHVSGKPRKYENQPGIGVSLDIHPAALKWVKDPSRPLFVTEGIRKGDSGVAKGLACIALLGVWNWRGTDESGALRVLRDWDEIHLKSRTVYVVFDSDVMLKRSVKVALERLSRVLEGRGAIVKLIYLPPDKNDAKQGLDDWFARGGDVEDLLTLAEDKIRGLPEVIVSGRQLRDMTQDAVAALEAANDPPQVYRWMQTLARILVDEQGRPFVEPYDPTSIKGQLTAVADFYKVLKGGQRVPVAPPDQVANHILALPEWSFPTLEAVVETPTVLPGGLVLDQPGYDANMRLVYIPDADFSMPRVPESPSSRWVKGARELLMEVFRDFPFVDDASRANTLALLLTPILRPAIDGPVPMALLDAPQAGTGKSLISEVVALVTTGRNAEMMSPSRDEEEWRKQITSTLMKAPSLVVIDNLMGRFTSASVARALTATIWKDRILGLSETAHLPQRATWMATGNNILLGGDLPRRTYLIQLNAEVARPWLREREAFAHPELLAWVKDERPRLLAAILTLIRAWYAADSPVPNDVPVLGSYEDWCRMVGGVLANAGIEGFLENLDDLYEYLDPGEQQWEAFVEALFREFGNKRFHARSIYTLAGWGQVLANVLPDELAAEMNDYNEGRFVRKLGWALRDRQRRRYGEDGLYLLGVTDRTKAKLWRVVRPKDQEGAGESEAPARRTPR